MPKKRAPKKSPAKKPANKPAARKPAAKKPAASKPAAKKPAARKPAARKPAAKKPAAKRPASRSRTRSGTRSAGAPASTQGRLAELERLIEVMVEREVVEVEFRQGDARWRVRRAEPQAVAFTAPAPATIPVGVPAAGGREAPVAGPVAGADAAEPQGEVFKSPMVGTFYRAPSPDAEPFCKSGDQVVSDRTICIIEAMKVMNEIKAEREFEVLDVLVKNGESVEFGQPLFLIR